jgi:glycolate dehydrogenase FAD-binding subunit
MVADQELKQVPNTPAEMAEMLRHASEERLSVVLRGAGTKLDWGRAPQRVDATISTRGLHRVIAHQHGDLTATIEAGASLREVNVALSLHKQWLPLDPSFASDATIGGILATNDSGPLRHRFGTPRDLVIGTEVATADGVLAKSGGQVVKNVAGYDLSKLLAGSFGSLAAIVTATFKLSPLPAASRTLVAAARDADELGRFVRDVMASQLEPIAFEIHVPSFALLLRFASVPSAVDAQAHAAERLLGAAKLLEGDAERALWSQHNERVWKGSGAIVRASWLPATVAAAIGELKACAVSAGVLEIEMLGRAAVGSGLIRIDGDAKAQARAIQQLRQSSSFGNVVLRRGSPELKSLVDVWDGDADRETLFASLKRAFDPQGILNAGRGPV